MWWLRTKIGIALACLLGLTACGFQPLYATRNTDTATQPLLANVFVETIPGRNGQLFRNRLTSRLAPRGQSSAAYSLVVQLAEEEESYLVRSDEIATRVDLILQADYRLIDRDTRETLTTGNVTRRVGFNLPDAEYAAVVSQSAARETGLKHLADQVAFRLATYFKNPASKTARQ